jgi:putative solute:sodium symporter small subunit
VHNPGGIGRKSYKHPPSRSVAFHIGPYAGDKTGTDGDMGGVATDGRWLPSHIRIRVARSAVGFMTRGGNRSMAPADTKANQEAHWRKTTNLMLMHLGTWFFFGYVIHMFVKPLNKIVIPILGFPLGFYMAAQGSLIVFVVMLFMFARQQNRIDREYGYAEDND